MKYPDVTTALDRANKALYELTFLIKGMREFEASHWGEGHLGQLTQLRAIPEIAAQMRECLEEMKALPGVSEAELAQPPQPSGAIYQGRKVEYIPRWREALTLAIDKAVSGVKDPSEVGLEETFILAALRVSSLSKEEKRAVATWMRQGGWELKRVTRHRQTISRWVKDGPSPLRLVWVSPTESYSLSPTEGR